MKFCQPLREKHLEQTGHPALGLNQGGQITVKLRHLQVDVVLKSYRISFKFSAAGDEPE
jgi:hypothetical protein